MKRHLIAMALALLTAVSCGIRGGDVATAEGGASDVAVADSRTFDVAPGDTLIATKLGVIDLGRMREGERVRGDFTLVNKCGRPIVILDVTGSCGCVGLDVDLRPFADGTSKRVALTYDSKGKEGRQAAMVSVKTSAGDYKIELKADVIKND